MKQRKLYLTDCHLRFGFFFFLFFLFVCKYLLRHFCWSLAKPLTAGIEEKKWKKKIFLMKFTSCLQETLWHTRTGGWQHLQATPLLLLLVTYTQRETQWVGTSTSVKWQKCCESVCLFANGISFSSFRKWKVFANRCTFPFALLHNWLCYNVIQILRLFCMLASAGISTLEFLGNAHEIL